MDHPTCKRRPVKFLCLTSLSVRTSRSVHAAARGVMTTSRYVRAGRAASFRSSLWLSSTPPRVHCIFFIHSSAGGYLGRSHVLAIVTSAAKSRGVHVPFWISVSSR